jgi:hypothetical protein
MRQQPVGGFHMRQQPVGDVPMFDVAAPPTPSKGRPFPGPHTVRRVLCPGGEHQAGLIVGTGEHLVWRKHLVHTVGGLTWLCQVVGKCLCQAPAPQVKGVHTPTCQDPASGHWAYDPATPLCYPIVNVPTGGVL